jgi:hypothetical protein
VLDVCRWGLGVDYPVQVSSMGGKLRYDDDQETPDTNVVNFKFENNKFLTWEGAAGAAACRATRTTRSRSSATAARC